MEKPIGGVNQSCSEFRTLQHYNWEQITAPVLVNLCQTDLKVNPLLQVWCQQSCSSWLFNIKPDIFFRTDDSTRRDSCPSKPCQIFNSLWTTFMVPAGRLWSSLGSLQDSSHVRPPCFLSGFLIIGSHCVLMMPATWQQVPWAVSHPVVVSRDDISNYPRPRGASVIKSLIFNGRELAWMSVWCCSQISEGHSVWSK